MRLPRSVVLITALSKFGTGVGGRQGGCWACATLVSATSAAATTGNLVRMGPPEDDPTMLIRSHLLAAHLRDPDRRLPWALLPADAFACNLHVEEIRLALDGVLAGTRQRLAQLRRIVHHLAIDPKALGNGGHVHVRIAEVVVHELAGLHHAAARHVVDDAA